MSSDQTTKLETIQEAKDRLVDEIVVYRPTGEITNVQKWEIYQGEAFATVFLSDRGRRRVPSAALVEFGYQDALDVLARPAR